MKDFKHIKVSKDTHTQIKQMAKDNGMFIDAFVAKLIQTQKRADALRELGVK